MADTKRKLKTILTFASEEIFNRAIAETNTSALVEALLSKHYGITIPTDTVQQQMRHAALESSEAKTETPEPTAPAVEQILPTTEVVDELGDEDGDLDTEQEPEDAPVTTAPSAEDVHPAAMPDLPIAPAPAAAEPEAPAFAPIYPAGQEPKPAPEPDPPYSAGDKVCPTCGKVFSPLPYCVECL